MQDLTPSSRADPKLPRNYAVSHGYKEDEALEKGMEEKSLEFVKTAAEVYRLSPRPVSKGPVARREWSHVRYKAGRVNLPSKRG